MCALESGHAQVRALKAGAVEIGLITSEPLNRMRITPYLALNRASFTVKLPDLDEERIVKTEPFEGVRDIEWASADDGSIIVDDLDEGFSVDEPETRELLRVSGRAAADEETDEGLPVAPPGSISARWARRRRW